MNSSDLHCIIDCSGSMAEYGKPMLVVNLLRYIRQFSEQQGINTHYLYWQSGIADIKWSLDMDVELPAREGSSNATALCDWARAHSQVPLLVLTDGYLELNAEHRLQLAGLSNLYLIGVGGDADLQQLRTLSDLSYRAAELDHVLHLIHRKEIASTAPSSLVALTEASSVNDTVEDDEW